MYICGNDKKSFFLKLLSLWPWRGDYFGECQLWTDCKLWTDYRFTLMPHSHLSVKPSVVRFSHESSASVKIALIENMKDHSHLVRRPSSVVSQNRSRSDFDGRRMRTINHGNELWIIPLSTTFPDCTHLKLPVHRNLCPQLWKDW